MAVIVCDAGFAQDAWPGNFLTLQADAEKLTTHTGYALDLPNTAHPEDLVPYFERAAMIRVGFPNFADGRGFTVARGLRMLGYRGRLRAQGHVLADQYAMARRCGFDEVEIDDDLARRQPGEQWLYRANWRAHDYQSRLRNGAPAADMHG